MLQRLETNACRTCAAAKRKCTKQRPQCSRCQKQGIDCRYPPSKPSAFVLISDSDDSADDLQIVTSTSLLPVRSGLDLSALSSDPYRCDCSIRHIPSNPTLDRTLVSTWFSGPSTWQVMNWPQTRHLWHPRGYNIKRLVAIIYHWYLQWLHTTANPFIHREFYRHRFPRCTQDASSTLASYLQRTPENTASLLRLIDSRAEQLLTDHGVDLTDQSRPAIYSSGSARRVTASLDTNGHVARIHALSLYQLLSLFAPKPQLRRRAEDRIPVLVKWMQDLINHAKSVIPSLSETLYDESSPTTASPSNYEDDRLWHSWILAESARRAFMIGTTIQSLYLVLRDGITASAAARHNLLGGGCAGGMPFTTRKGAWDAVDAQQWAQLAVEIDFGLTYVQDARNLLRKEGLREEWDVDTFAEVFIRGTYGRVG